MSPDLDKKLCEKYPEIFTMITNPGVPPHLPISLFSFECSDGWYNIIDRLCANIKAHVDNHNHNVESNIKHKKIRDAALNGDWSIFNKDYERLYPSSLINNSKYWNEEKAKEHREQMMRELIGDIPDWRKNLEYIKSPVAVQVKEKFGTLRFYYDGGDRYIDGLVNMAESMSAVTCEVCGNPGKIRTGGWVRTLCDTHAVERGYDLEEIKTEEKL